MPAPRPDANGTATVEGGTATPTFAHRLRHPIEAVWAAITDPEQRTRWLGPAVIDPRPEASSRPTPAALPSPTRPGT
jgi:uncharacterized protein YndB with AHSA1/START domain